MSETMSTEARAITRYIIDHPGSSEYKIHDDVKIELEKQARVEAKKHKAIFDPKKFTFNRILVLRWVDKLQARGFLRVEKGPRNAKLCWLTDKGLVYAIKQDLIEPKDALSTMQKHKLEIPSTRRCGMYGDDDTGKCEYIKRFMEKQPEAFFKVLSRLPNILDTSQNDLSKYTCPATMLGAAYLFLTDAEFYGKSYQNDELNLGCHGISGVSESGAGFIMVILKPFLSVLGFDIPKEPPCKFLD